MIKTVRKDVLERLRRKRFSAEPQLESVGNRYLHNNFDETQQSPAPRDVRAFILAKKSKEESENLFKSQIDFIDKLEKFEELHPEALKIFIDEAKKRGIYKAKLARISTKIGANHLKSPLSLNDSIDLGHNAMDDYTNKKKYESYSKDRINVSSLEKISPNKKYAKYIVQKLDDKETASQRYNYYKQKLKEIERQQQQQYEGQNNGSYGKLNNTTTANSPLNQQMMINNKLLNNTNTASAQQSSNIKPSQNSKGNATIQLQLIKTDSEASQYHDLNPQSNTAKSKHHNHLNRHLHLDSDMYMDSQLSPQHSTKHQVINESLAISVRDASFPHKNNKDTNAWRDRPSAIMVEDSFEKGRGTSSIKIKSKANNNSQGTATDIEQALNRTEGNNPPTTKKKSKLNINNSGIGNVGGTGNSEGAGRIDQEGDKISSMQSGNNKYLSIVSNPFSEKSKKNTEHLSQNQQNSSLYSDEHTIIKRILIIQKIPKLQVLLDKNERFNDFYKRLCTTNFSINSNTNGSSGNTNAQGKSKGNTNSSLYSPTIKAQYSLNSSQLQISNPKSRIDLPHIGVGVSSKNLDSSKVQIGGNVYSNSNNATKQPNVQPQLNQQQQQQLQFSQGYVLKSLRLSKQNIKGHIAKRYGKSFSDKIMQILESYNKSMHNIELNGYIDLLNYLFLSVQVYSGQGQNIQVPNIYKFLFQVLDVGNKGFICEHDLFQVLWSLSNDKANANTNSTSNMNRINESGAHDTSQINGPAQSNAQNAVKRRESINIQGSITTYDNEQINLSINYRDHIPQIKRSVFIECFQNDFNLITRELERIHQHNLFLSFQAKDSNVGCLLNIANMNQATYLGSQQTKKKASFRSLAKKTNNRSNFLIEGEDSEEISNYTTAGRTQKKTKKVARRLTVTQATIGRVSSMGATPRGGAKDSPRRRNIPLTKKILEAIHQHAQSCLDTVESVPKNQQTLQLMNQSISPQISAFSHFNPASQALKEKKEISRQLHGFKIQEPCKQINFEQFVRLQFELEIPLFIEDFFQHMTTLSFRTLVKKQLNQGSAQLPSVQKDHKTRNSSSKIALLIDEDYQFNRRKLQYVQILKHYDNNEINAIFQVFKLLSYNGLSETNKFNMFMTQQSILDNFKKVFLYFNESFALRFYNLLSEGVNMKRIYITQYLMTLIPLFKGTLADKSLFIFKLLDGDNDGQLQSQDISDILTNVLVCPVQNDIKSCTCPLFKEVHKLYKEYVRSNLLTYTVKKLHLDFQYYMTKIQYSSLIGELTDKLSMRHQRPSIFSHEPSDLEKTKAIYQHEIAEYEKEFNQMKVKGLTAICLQTQQKVNTIQAQIMDVSNSPMLIDQESNQQQLFDDEEISPIHQQLNRLIGTEFQRIIYESHGLGDL